MRRELRSEGLKYIMSAQFFPDIAVQRMGTSLVFHKVDEDDDEGDVIIFFAPLKKNLFHNWQQFIS